MLTISLSFKMDGGGDSSQSLSIIQQTLVDARDFGFFIYSIPWSFHPWKIDFWTFSWSKNGFWYMDGFLFTLCRPAHPPDFGAIGTRDWTPMTIRTSEHLVLWSHGLSSVMSHHRSVNDSYSLYREYSVTTTERGWVAIMLRTYTRLWNSHVPCGFSRTSTSRMTDWTSFSLTLPIQDPPSTITTLQNTFVPSIFKLGRVQFQHSQ